MRVIATIIDGHCDKKDYQVDDNECKNDTCVSSSPTRTGFKEWGLVFILKKFCSEIERECGFLMILNWVCNADLGIIFFFFHFSSTARLSDFLGFMSSNRKKAFKRDFVMAVGFGGKHVYRYTV